MHVRDSELRCDKFESPTPAKQDLLTLPVCASAAAEFPLSKSYLKRRESFQIEQFDTSLIL